MAHHDSRSVACSGPEPKCGGGTCGFAMFITKWGGRRDISSMATLIVCFGGRDSYDMTANLAAAFAMSLPVMFVWDLILWRVVLRPFLGLSSRRSVMSPRRRPW
jgi:hypothetical protein